MRRGGAAGDGPSDRSERRAFVSGLALAGVRSNRIHYEFFEPADEILTAA